MVGRKAPSIRDVAELAGVSHMTVSRVLNNSPKLRPETRKRVEIAIAELGYEPNVLAQSLAAGRSRQIGILVHAYSEYGPMSMLRSMYSAALDSGYVPVVYMLEKGTTDEVQEGLSALSSRRVDGLAIILPQVSALPFLNSAELPKVSVLFSSVPQESIPECSAVKVCINQYGGARKAVQHFIDRGHRRIAHIAGPQDWFDAQERLAAWEDVLSAAGLEKPAAIFGDWSAQSGYDAADQVAQIPGITAVFSANDQMALGLIHGLKDKGYRVPEDISVIGFDGQPDSGHFLPPLTTVEQDFSSLGNLGMKILLNELENQPSQIPIAPVEPRLRVRSSVRSLP